VSETPIYFESDCCMLQAQAAIADGVQVALDQLTSQGMLAKGVGVAVGALAIYGMDMDAVLSVLMEDIPYPYNTILPGMVKANMLEFYVDLSGDNSMRLRLCQDWTRALLSLGTEIEDDSGSSGAATS
jgi:hypothetical protein